ncbi:DUF5107 domain-containing protein [Carnobacterium gallinarum]|uniref:DUF5107 domain-containing protein n=1 Tax=Carnobacterium gallinarum TaxID=2749 RepID=UPI000553C8F6|nr:DUF5107 domain-containing protein [Carnobacterium gallinarum]
MKKGTVQIQEEKIMIPTYLAAEPDKNPLFFEKRVYQGSSGKVYPLPVTEKIADEQVDVEYQAIYLENEYLKVTILPELGGRIQRAYDKTNDYDFVYYNQVIKPALVGLVGPWISGGIEFNWPQHHRPSTFMPTEYQLTENPDGSKTVWVSEIDQMYGTKGMAGFTLYPDKAYIEITGKVYNRTDIPQTFLWWANPAVPVNDHTISVFPPDVHAVMDHGKRAVSSFPIATGTYYKYDYSEGVDISKYKNIKVPTSYMAYHSDFDFIGNYDEQKQAGLLHVADHHVSPGKKQWTWGNSDFGQAWDRNLTDEDGPYIELMTGVFTDNQPDFTWLKPYEEKTFKQYFMPYKGVGRVKNATIQAAVNVELEMNQLVVTIYGTQVYSKAQVRVTLEEELLFAKEIELAPENFFQEKIPTNLTVISTDLHIQVLSQTGDILVDYRGIADELEALPEPAEELLRPEELKSTEELFLAATHIEQYRHATLDAEDYYLEGLKRESEDIRLNNGYGLFLYRKGLFAESEVFFRKAVAKLTWKSPNPYYGEPLFNLGLTLKIQNKLTESYDCFYKATWNEDSKSAAFYQLACLEALDGNFASALEFLEQALVKNQHHMKARLLQVTILRHQKLDINEPIQANLAIDPLDLGSHYERGVAQESLAKWHQVMRGSVHNYLEVALDYINAGFYQDALIILASSPVRNPMISYYQAYIYSQLDQKAEALAQINRGEQASSDYCFPNRLMEIVILEKVIALQPEKTGYAQYYLGNLFYDKRRYQEAIKLWEVSKKLVPEFPTVYRNLSFAYYNQTQDLPKSQALISTATELDSSDARLLLEQDLLAAKKGSPIGNRIAILEAHIQTTEKRDDLFGTYITLLNSLGKHQKAFDLIASRQFHPWEGGEGKISGQYVYALIELAKLEAHQNPQEALEKLSASMEFPHFLGEGKLPNVQDTIAYYYMAKIYQQIGEKEQAIHYFELATEGITEPESVLYYYDQPADSLLYQGMAQSELGNQQKANACFHKLIAYGQQHLFDQVSYDYFAVSLPETVVFTEDIQQNNRIYCQYLIALGQLGLGEIKSAIEGLTEILVVVPDHQGAIRHLALAEGE